MLKDFMKANGLALEGEEPTAPIGEMVEAVETQGEEIEQAQSDIETAEEAVQTLESLVLAFESVAGDRTALEKHLFVGHVTTLYAQMGLAKPAQVSLESADDVSLSMEGFKETAKKIWEAIKAAWDKLVKMVKDWWAKVNDVAGRLHKKLSAKLKETDKTEVSFKAMTVDIGIPTIDDSHLAMAFAKKDIQAVVDASDELMRKIADVIRNSDWDTLNATIGTLQEGEKAEEQARVETTFNVSVNKAGMAILGQLNTISKYHRDWASRQSRKETLVREFTEAYTKSAEDAGRKRPEWVMRSLGKAIMRDVRAEQRNMMSVINQLIRISNAFMAEL